MSNHPLYNLTTLFGARDGKLPLIDCLQDAADGKDDGEVIYLSERCAMQVSVDCTLNNLVELDMHLSRNCGQDTDIEAAPEDTLVLQMFFNNFQRLLMNMQSMKPKHIAP